VALVLGLKNRHAAGVASDCAVEGKTVALMGARGQASTQRVGARIGAGAEVVPCMKNPILT
jgi:hypothetical protein